MRPLIPATLRRLLWPRRLRQQVSLLGVLMLLLSTGAITAYLTASHIDYQLQTKKTELEFLAHDIAGSISASLITGKYSRVEEMLILHSSLPGVLKLLVTNEHGKSLIMAERSAGLNPRIRYSGETILLPASAKALLNTRKDQFTVWQPIEIGTLIGWLKIDYSLEQLRKNQEQTLVKGLAIGVAAGTLGAALFLMFLVYPMRAISQATEFARRLNQNQGETFTPDRSARELEQLGEALNQASHQLHQQAQDLIAANTGMQLAAIVFDTMGTAGLVTDKDTRIVKVNPAFTTITGYTSEEAIGNTPRMLSSGTHSREFYAEMWNTIKATDNWHGEILDRRKNGEIFTQGQSITAVRDNEGNITNYVSLFLDISERKATEKHMHTMAHYDSLTGLPNRTLLVDRLQQAISAARREKSHMALMFIDLDKFKLVNDTLGHPIGDLLLEDVAKRILECLRESDSAARIGGDEFVVLLPMIEVASDAVAVAEKIRYTLNQPFIIGGHSLSISSSTGVAVYPDHGIDEKSLLKNADTAMYYAKGAGRNNVMLYASSLVHHDKL